MQSGMGDGTSRFPMPEFSPPPAPVHLPWWRWINWLALDAVAVAVAWLPVFAHLTGARLTPVNTGALAAGVWLFYMADRILDGLTGHGKKGRHHFAGRQAAWLLALMVAVAAGSGYWMLHGMRAITVQAGVWVAMAGLLYFGIVAASRWKPVSQVLLLGVSVLMIMGLVQQEAHIAAGFQLWRAIAAGTLLTVLFFGLRQQYDPPPWILVKKGLGGYLFALGVAVGPFSHVMDWDGLIRAAPVMLFAGACMLNSLGIRLWENPTASDPESLLLRRLYPWLLAAIGLGAAAEAWGADAWSRPLLLGVAACNAGFAVLHLLRNRWPAGVYSLAADGIMVVAALLAGYFGPRSLP